MIHYSGIKSRIYLETTVISYLVGRPSLNARLASWQEASRQLWEDYTDRFEFVISPIVVAEVSQGNPDAAQQRLAALSDLTVLEISPAADRLTQKLLDAGAVPQSSNPDTQQSLLPQWLELNILHRGTRNIL